MIIDLYTNLGVGCKKNWLFCTYLGVRCKTYMVFTTIQNIKNHWIIAPSSQKCVKITCNIFIYMIRHDFFSRGMQKTPHEA